MQCMRVFRWFCGVGDDAPSKSQRGTLSDVSLPCERRKAHLEVALEHCLRSIRMFFEEAPYLPDAWDEVPGATSKPSVVRLNRIVVR